MNRTMTTTNRGFIRLLIFIFLLFLFHPGILAAGEVTLAWDPNSEWDLAGYKLYYDGDSDTERYKGTGANGGDSPIFIYLDDLDDTDSPIYTVTGLEDGQYYYFALTAFNIDGLESSFSEEVGVKIGSTSDLMKAVYNSSSTSSTDSASSGGNSCFITCGVNDPIQGFPMALAGMLLLLISVAVSCSRPIFLRVFRRK